MADVKLLAPKIFKWEGDFVNDPTDRGGATNKGVTIATWRQVGYDKDGDGDIDVQDLKKLTVEDATIVLKKFYWDRWKGDEIRNQQIADIVVDWVWGSGKHGITKVQELLGFKGKDVDGNVGPKTMAALNAQDPKVFHQKIWNRRLKFLEDIVKNNPSQGKFIKGWKNRLNDFKWHA